MKYNEQLEILKSRTKRFAVEIVRLHSTLPKSTESQIIGRQLVRSGTLVGAHYREALRACTSTECIAKLETGINALEETTYWLELLEESGISGDYVLEALREEAGKLIALFKAIAKKARPRRNLKTKAVMLE